MKSIIFIIFITLLTGYAQAEVYVVTDKNTKDVISISNENDCVVGSSMELTVMNGDIKDITITKQPQYYKLKGNKLVANLEKISQKENEELVTYEKEKEEREIEKYRKNKAIDEMTANGKAFKYSHKID